jgi:hypothetical protein
VRTAGRIDTLHARTLGEVEFITYRDDLSGSITCGPLEDSMRVYVTWRAGTTAGERRVVAVEFVR